jgi:hypothetical protein
VRAYVRTYVRARVVHYSVGTRTYVEYVRTCWHTYSRAVAVQHRRTMTGRLLVLLPLLGFDSTAARNTDTFAANATSIGVFPAPFSRPLQLVPGQEWQQNGSDVVVAQHLLRRSRFARPTTQCCSGVYDEDTANIVAAVQQGAKLPLPTAGSGTLDVAMAAYLLSTSSFDGYVDDGRSAREQGYLFKILVPVHTNRSIETEGQLLDADDNVLFTFPARAHGHDVLPNGQPDDRPWPDYDNDNGGLNQFSTSGATPTGLSQCNLESPEDDTKSFG